MRFKPGDVVRHTRYGYLGVVLKTTEIHLRTYSMDVVTDSGIIRHSWFDVDQWELVYSAA